MRIASLALAALAALATLAPLAACDDGGGDGDSDGTPDAGGVTLDHCSFEPMPPNGNATGTVTAGMLTAGAAEGTLDFPVGSALGAYTARTGFLGNAGVVDKRKWPYSGGFNASIGIETRPMLKVIALSAGGEDVLILKFDVGSTYEAIDVDLAARLGARFNGKILHANSHTHSGPGHYTAHSGFGLGFSRFRRHTYDLLLDRMEALAMQALAARQPARLGVFVDDAFDPGDEITRDRRGENDDLPFADQKDPVLAMIRIDATDGTPIAVIPIFGIHGTILGDDNPLMSTDAPGAIERGLEEQFDAKVVVMHLQGAGGDISPAGHGGIDCDGLEFCAGFSSAEGTGRAGVPVLYAAWQAAGESMVDSLELEMVTRSVELGPRHDTFAVRGGALEYLPFDDTRVADQDVFDATGAVISPIDEFNAPYGAALCGEIDTNAIFPAGQLPGTECLSDCEGIEFAAYQSCVKIDTLAPLIGDLFKIDVEGAPICQSTRTTISALRLGEFVIATMPGEATALIARALRDRSPAGADKTIVVGYAQGHVGYILTPEDWLRSGYEPSITFWGPLEGEYLLEQALALLPLALSAEREDGAAGGADRVATPATTDDSDVPPPDPAPMAGVVPDSVPSEVYLRGKPTLVSAQPAATVPRLGSARFVWIGEDPLTGTPSVTLQRETAPGSGMFADVVRRSGRPVADHDLLITWTPVPLSRAAGEHATHYWAVEWQAVTWWGVDEAGLTDDLADRPGVPAGVYRFAVTGTGYEVTSDAFTVVPATLGVTAGASGAQITGAVAYAGDGGWRLLGLAGHSNRPVPARHQSVEIRLEDGGGAELESFEISLAADGSYAVTPAGGTAAVKKVVVTDRFGNRGEAAPP